MSFATDAWCYSITTCDAPFTTTVSRECARFAMNASACGGIFRSRSPYTINVTAAFAGPVCQSSAVTGVNNDGCVAVGANVGVGPAGRAVAAAVVIGTCVATGGLVAGTGVALGVGAWAQPARNSAVASSLAHGGRMRTILPLGLSQSRSVAFDYNRANAFEGRARRR